MKQSSNERSLSATTPEDRSSGELNGMPPFEDIERIAELEELAEETIKKLPPNNPQRLQIEQALANLKRTHGVADNLDTDNQCGSRALVRRKMV